MSELTKTSETRKPYNAGAVRAFTEDHLSRGVVAFSLDELLRDVELNPLAAHKQLQRMSSLVVKLPRKEFFLIVPPEHKPMGVPPPAWWLDDYFAWLKHPYYLALQSAAVVYGSEPQAVQVAQVMTDCVRKPLNLGRLTIRFFLKKSTLSTPVQQPLQARAPLRVSTPAATALDLIRYSSRLGGLPRAWDTISPLLPKITVPDLRSSLAAENEPALAQRLGYLLEQSGDRRLSPVVSRWLPSSAPWCLLDPGSAARSGPRIARWRLWQNSDL
jgi:hypothetical protein